VFETDNETFCDAGKFRDCRHLHGPGDDNETFPDARETIEDMVTEGSKVAVRHRFTGTQTGPMGPYPPSGRSMTAEYIAVYRIEGDAIVESWAEWDNLNGLMQLGHYQAAAQPGTAQRQQPPSAPVAAR
jgi:hypothetical protein